MDPAQISLPPDVAPVEPQVDYRSNPSAGGAGSTQQHVGSYDHPNDDGAVSVPTWTDQTWKSIDSPLDATRFNGINTPEQQAQLLMGAASQGYSADSVASLRWERAGGAGDAP